LSIFNAQTLRVELLPASHFRPPDGPDTLPPVSQGGFDDLFSCAVQVLVQGAPCRAFPPGRSEPVRVDGEFLRFTRSPPLDHCLPARDVSGPVVDWSRSRLFLLMRLSAFLLCREGVINNSTGAECLARSPQGRHLDGKPFRVEEIASTSRLFIAASSSLFVSRSPVLLPAGFAAADPLNRALLSRARGLLEYPAESRRPVDNTVSPSASSKRPTRRCSAP